jgi:predicted DNA-binding protein
MQTVAKKKLSRQIVFRVPEDVGRQLDELAPHYGQDVSGFLRLILQEQLPKYRRQVERRQQGEEEGGPLR